MSASESEKSDSNLNGSDGSESGEDSSDDESGSSCGSGDDIVASVQKALKAPKAKKQHDDLLKGAPHLLRIAALDLDLPTILANGVLHEAALAVGSSSEM